MNTAEILIETDGRGRTSLSKFAESAKNARFLGRQEEDGTIILEPAVLVTAAQDRLRRNPEALERVEKALARQDQAVTVDLAGDAD